MTSVTESSSMQVFQRTQADGLVQHLLGEAAAVDGLGKIVRKFLLNDLVDHGGCLLAQIVVGHAAHVDPTQIHLPNDRLVHASAPFEHVGRRWQGCRKTP